MQYCLQFIRNYVRFFVMRKNMEEKAIFIFSGPCLRVFSRIVIYNFLHTNDVSSMLEKFELRYLAETNVNLIYAKGRIHRYR